MVVLESVWRAGCLPAEPQPREAACNTLATRLAVGWRRRRVRRSVAVFLRRYFMQLAQLLACGGQLRIVDKGVDHRAGGRLVRTLHQLDQFLLTLCLCCD